ncbi:MAG: cardiolipin synthase [Planctomycetes bacterium]|nr:cardiolipin synthase [Planctomycetota bacterium]
MTWSWSTLLILFEWGIRLVMMPVVLRRRTTAQAMAWLLIIFFEPLLGLGLFLLVGTNRLPRRRIAQHAQATRVLDMIHRLQRSKPHVMRPKVDPEQAGLIALTENLGDLAILGGNDFEMMTDTDVVIDRLVADIASAKQHVHILMYIFHDDRVGRRVAAALIAAQQRGVACRVLADAVGAKPMFVELAALMSEAGVRVQPALPVSYIRRRLARMDLRNHRKLIVIDGAICYVGSQNIVEPEYGRGNLAWHDLMLRVTGPVSLQLQSVFVEDWFSETSERLDADAYFPEPRVTGKVAIQTLPSGPTYPTQNYQRLIVAALYAAKRHVIITTPYFVPDEALLQALEVAVLREVVVDIIVPRQADQVLAGAAGRAYYARLMEMGVRLHLHQEGLLHAKTMSVDDAIALVGSGNFDMRSFYLNFELNMVLYGPEVAAQLRYQQNQYIAKSHLLTQREWGDRPAYRRLFDDCARLLSPLL